jgi:serine/threonine-protein kinase HipA
MSEQLFVHYQKQLVGFITQTASRTMHFEYDESWLRSSSNFPISISLPLDGSFADAACHHFFSNLLPEANVREQICKSLKISANNDFDLLTAIGGDCAGALTITVSNIIDSNDLVPRYEPVTERQLGLWSVGTPNAFAAVTGHSEVRLSLAGAQDKLPVHVDGDQLFIPIGNTPSTYILKFASPHYSHLPENETFITMLAKEVGLPVVDVRVRKTAKSTVTLIARYDRQLESGRWLRLHQEDFCQALGIDVSLKYQKEGGPSFKQCADVIKQHTAYPLIDLQKLMRWSLFNLLVGNADAHGKNLSLLYSTSGTASLAPFYDLVCTRNYKNLSCSMAMSLGGVWDPDLVTMKHLDGLADDLGTRTNVVIEEASELSERVATSLPIVIESYRQQFGESPVLQRLPIITRKMVRRVRAQLK